MLIDAPQAEATDGDEAIVIIGGGTVGLYLAALLTEKGVRVKVVESGNSILSSFTNDSFRSIGRPHQGVSSGRARALGGTSNLWGGQLVEFQPIDFGSRASPAMSGWPISYSDCAPYVRATYERLGIDQPAQDDSAVWRARVGQVPEFSEGIEVFLTRWMKTPSMAVLYGQAIQDDARLEVVPDHTVVGFQADGGRITAVIAKDKDGRPVRIAGDQFVVAAGTVETVRLLLAAAADQSWDCPWAANPMLGLRFQDHLGGRLGTIIPLDKRRLFESFATIYWNGHKFQPKLRVTEEVLHKSCLLGAQGIVVFESSAAEHLVFLKQFLKAAIYSRRIAGVWDFFRHAVACLRYLPPLMWTYVKEHRMFVPFDSKIVLNVQAEQLPLDRSRITLDHSRHDRLGLPAAVVDWQVSGDELPSIRNLADRCAKALEEAGLGRLEIEPDLQAMKPRFLDTLHDTYHAAGGAVMGRTDATGVVDGDLCVFGTENLYVASAATFPSSSSANVTFMALVLATRLADHLT